MEVCESPKIVVPVLLSNILRCVAFFVDHSNAERLLKSRRNANNDFLLKNTSCPSRRGRVFLSFVKKSIKRDFLDHQNYPLCVKGIDSNRSKNPYLCHNNLFSLSLF